MFLEHLHPPFALDGLARLLLLPLAPLQLCAIILLIRVLQGHFVPSLEPLHLIDLPVLLPVLSVLVAALALSGLEVRVHEDVRVGLAVGEFFLGFEGAGVLGPPCGTLLARALVACPLVLSTFFTKLLGVLAAVELSQVLAHHVYAEWTVLERLCEVDIRLLVHFFWSLWL